MVEESKHDRVSKLVKEYSAGVPGLEEEIHNKFFKINVDEGAPKEGGARAKVRPIFSEDDDIAIERIVAHMRPVMRIRENKLTGEWVGEPESDSWSGAIAAARVFVMPAIASRSCLASLGPDSPASMLAASRSVRPAV